MGESEAQGEWGFIPESRGVNSANTVNEVEMRWDDDERSALISGRPNAPTSSGKWRCACTALVSFSLGMMALRALQLSTSEEMSSPSLSVELARTRHALHLARMASPPAVRVADFKSVVNDSLDWVEQQAPHFECEDEDITATYWYRWRLFRLHMVRRPQRARGCGKPEGCWVLTEFLRKVWWGGAFGTIVCPASHHIMEGRWLRDEAIIDEYARFWFTGEGYRKQYVNWLVYALWQRSLVLHATPAQGVVAELFGHLDAHYHDWMRTHYHSTAGCMYTSCHADGEENSAGLDGCRPTINSVMYGEATALSSIARALGNATRAHYFERQAERWRDVLLHRLWSEELGFFVNEAQEPPAGLCGHRQRTCPRGRRITTGCLGCRADRTCPPPRGYPVGERVPVRELMGLSSPWYFRAVPDDAMRSRKYATAFAQLDDPDGFGARFGPRTTERRCMLTLTLCPTLTLILTLCPTPPQPQRIPPEPRIVVHAHPTPSPKQVRVLQLFHTRAVQLERR